MQDYTLHMGPNVCDSNGAIRPANQSELDRGHVSKIHADESAKGESEALDRKTAKLRELRDDLAALSN